MDEFDKFTVEAREVITLALEEAQFLNHSYIGTEHILLGLSRMDQSAAARVLHSFGIQLLKIRSCVEFIVGRGEGVVVGEIGLTPRAMQVIKLAVEESSRLGHQNIRAEHLLLGILREGSGVAVVALDSLGVSLERLRERTLQSSQQTDQQVDDEPDLTIDDFLRAASILQSLSLEGILASLFRDDPDNLYQKLKGRPRTQQYLAHILAASLLKK